MWARRMERHWWGSDSSSASHQLGDLGLITPLSVLSLVARNEGVPPVCYFTTLQGISHRVSDQED